MWYGSEPSKRSNSRLAIVGFGQGGLLAYEQAFCCRVRLRTHAHDPYVERVEARWMQTEVKYAKYCANTYAK
jgi:hypothetical protein